MKRTIVILAILLVVGAAAAAGWWYVNQNPGVWSLAQDEVQKAVDELGLQPAEAANGIVASGFIEAKEALVTTELGGRIVAILPDEGDEVAQGEVLVKLDDSLFLAQIEMAKADVAVTEAKLAQVKTGVRQETLDYALAQVAQAETAQQAALVAWEDAQAILEKPQDLELAITAARAQLGVLDHQVQQAQAMANSAQVGRDLSDAAVALLEDFEPFTVKIPIAPGVDYKKRIRLPSDMLPNAQYEQAVATYQSWQAWTGVDQAQAAQQGAEQILAELLRQKADPLTLEAQANAAKSQYDIAAATVELAQAQVEGLEMGATPEQIAAVEAQAKIARAALEALEVQLSKLRLEAPISGLVLERPVNVGELAVPGAPLLTLADLDNVTLTVYVPEDQLGRVQLGQRASVTVDAYPDRTFLGEVTFIATQGEFTPRNVQTREERVNVVFAVKISLPNADHALKAGMPADAVLVDG